MTCSVTAALIHKRVSRLQALVRGRQTRRRVVEAMQRDYRSVCVRLNREAFGDGREEPPYEDLADLAFFEDGDEWGGSAKGGGSATRPPPQGLDGLSQLMPKPPRGGRRQQAEAPASFGAATGAGDRSHHQQHHRLLQEPSSSSSSSSSSSAAAASASASSISPASESAPRRSKEEVLAELAWVRRRIEVRTCICCLFEWGCLVMSWDGDRGGAADCKSSPTCSSQALERRRQQQQQQEEEKEMQSQSSSAPQPRVIIAAQADQ
jgi:hypothetical protein